MASFQQNRVQSAKVEASTGDVALDGKQADFFNMAGNGIELSEHDEIAQLTRAIQSIVSADKRISELFNAMDAENKHKPTLWLR